MTVDKIIHKTTFKKALVEKRVLFSLNVNEVLKWQNQKQYIALNVEEKLLHGMGGQQSIYLQSVRNATNWLFTMLKMKMWKSKKFRKGKHQAE